MGKECFALSRDVESGVVEAVVLWDGMEVDVPLYREARWWMLGN